MWCFVGSLHFDNPVFWFWGAGISLSGNNAYISTGKKYNGLTHLTLEAWIRTSAAPTDTQKHAAIAGEGHVYDPGTGFGLFTDSRNASLRFQTIKGGTTMTAIYEGYPFVPTDWHHVVGVYDTDNNIRRLYVDGVEVATAAGVQDITTVAQNFSIGARYNGSKWAYYLKGQISDVRLWNHVRSPEEIVLAKNRRLVGDEEGLIAYWPLNEGTGTTVADIAGAAPNNGTMVNATWSTSTDLPVGLFDLVNPLTGSIRFTNSNEVDVVRFALPDAYDVYQVAYGDDSPVDLPAAWLSGDPAPATIAIPTAIGNSNVVINLWLTNSASSVAMGSMLNSIYYTTNKPALNVPASLTVGLVDGFTTAYVAMDEIDLGTTGGAAGGIAMKLLSRSFSCSSDMTPELPDTITFDTPGEYEVVYTAMNEAGNVAVATTVVSVVASDLTRWRYRAKIAVPGYEGSETLTNFPLLVKLSEAAIGGFRYDDTLPGGADLRFTYMDDSREIPYEIDTWDTAGTSLVWVSVPALVPEETYIWLWWHKPDVAQPLYTTNGAVWADGYLGVWHMADNGDSTQVLDSSPNRLHGTKLTTTKPLESAGLLGKGQSFDSSSIALTGFSDSGEEISFSLWVKSDSLASTQYMLDIETTRTILGYGAYDANDKIGIYYEKNWRHLGDSPPVNQWHHLLYVCGDGKIKLYVDGVDYGQYTPFTATVLGGDVTIGSYFKQTTHYFGGLMDELRFEKKIRSAAWAAATYATVVENDTWQSYGPAGGLLLAGIVNNGASNITVNSAILSGTLTATGGSATAVGVYYGDSDKGNNAANWAAHLWLDGEQQVGEKSIKLTGLDANALYYYRFAASNESGLVWSPASDWFTTGEVWLEKLGDAAEVGPTPGTVVVHRATASTNLALAVYYSVSGTATPDEDYVALSGVAEFPVGATNVVIEIMPHFDHWVEGVETVEIVLLPGVYAIDATADNVTVAIADYGRVTRTWSGGGGDTLASNPANWHEGEAPIAADAIVFDETGSGDTVWDIDVATGPWTQTADYSGTITFATYYPGRGAFTNLVINGDVILDGGTWTHAGNDGAEVERLCVTVNGDFSLGVNASLNVDGKGYAAQKGPGAGNNSKTTDGRTASHGGAGANNLAGSVVYGSIHYPESLGSGGWSRGGGAIKLAVSGEATLDGIVSAQGPNNGDDNRCHGSGGSILVDAGKISGTGTVRAGVSLDQAAYYGSGGGRIALYSAAATDFAGLTITANTHTQTRSGGGRAGTIFLSSPMHKRLIVDQHNVGSASGNYTDLVMPYAFDASHPAYGGPLEDAVLIVTNGAQVKLCNDLRLGGIGWLDGQLHLQKHSLFLKSVEPVNFPGGYGGGTIAVGGLYHTFINGDKIYRDGRLVWGNAPTSWRAVSVAHETGGGETSIDGGASEGYYLAGSELSFGAIASNDCTFVRWDGILDSGLSSGANPQMMAPLASNIVLRAWFLDLRLGNITNRWSGAAATDDWFEPNNWSLFSVPSAGQTVILDNGAVVSLYDSSAALGEFIMAGDAQLTFSNWGTKLEANSIELLGGTVTHAGPFKDDEMSNRVWFVSNDLLLGTNANINVNGSGYVKEKGPGAGVGQNTSGGGYGGHAGFNTTSHGLPYGTVDNPIYPGSGGSYTTGGSGGGVVRLEVANKATLFGNISANGDAGTSYSGGGSGGSIFITCKSWDGSDSALLNASGGKGPDTGGSGSGGRIALRYADTPGRNPGVRFKAAGGAKGNRGDKGEHGSLYLSDTSLLSADLDSNVQFQEVRLYFGVPSWSTPHLNASGSTIRFGGDNFKMVVAGDMVVSGAKEFGFGDWWSTNMTLEIGGDLIVRDNGTFYVVSGPTNGLAPEYGCLVDVKGDILLNSPAAYIYPTAHETNGGTVRMRARNAYIAAGCAISASNRGWRSEYGLGAGVRSGNSSGGGGYGGAGGTGGKGGAGGNVYDSAYFPEHPGSGGGYEVAAAMLKGNLGVAQFISIWPVAARLTVRWRQTVRELAVIWGLAPVAAFWCAARPSLAWGR